MTVTDCVGVGWPTYSVLTRILPWGVPGPPLLRNRGPVRTLGGQSYLRSMKESNFCCAMVYQLFLHQQKPCSRYNLSLHSKWSVTWSTYLIQYGGQCVYDSITMHTPIFITYMGTTKLTAIQFKTESFDNMFFYSFEQAKCWGWPLKLLQSPYSKVRLTSSLPLCPNGRIFLAFNAPSQFFLQESRKAASWWEHCNQPNAKNTKILSYYLMGTCFLPVALSVKTINAHPFSTASEA